MSIHSCQRFNYVELEAHWEVFSKQVIFEQVYIYALLHFQKCVRKKKFRVEIFGQAPLEKKGTGVS